MKKSFLILAFLATCFHVFSQDEKARISDEMKKLAKTYGSSGSLSFNVSYYYAEEKSPGLYLDSLKGSCKMLGDRYWYTLDGTEAMYGEDYVVMLFKDDLIMYLGKPAAVIKKAHPLSQLDSIFINNKDVQGSIMESKDEIEVTFTFLPGLKYKKIEYHINRKTGLLNAIVNVVQSAELHDPQSKQQMADSSQYGVVEVIFSGYRLNLADAKDFDSGKYFKRTGKEFFPVFPYQSYKIFLGSPTLNK